MKNAILIVGIICVCFLSTSLAQKKKKKDDNNNIPKYPLLFRDHIYYDLSENGQEMFYGLGPHPICQDKEGVCIPRGHCHGVDMLYLSRVCYRRDLVCCYNMYKVPLTIGNITILPHKKLLRDSNYTSTDLGSVESVLRQEKIIDVMKILKNVEGIRILKDEERMNVLLGMNATEIQQIMQNIIDKIINAVEDEERIPANVEN